MYAARFMPIAELAALLLLAAMLRLPALTQL
jgi:hypothetical protein